MVRGDAHYPTVEIHQLERIVAEAERLGADPDALRRDAGMLELGDTTNPRVPVKILFDLWELAVDRSTRTLPIELAARTPLDAFGVLGFTVMTSASMADALDCGTNYYALLSNSGTWQVTTHEHEVRARWSRPGSSRRGTIISNESVLAHFIAGCRAIAGDHVRPRLVRFRHEAPSSYRALMEYFDTKVEFGADEDALVFGRDEMDHVPIQANAALHEFLRAQAEELLQPLSAQAFSEHVKLAIQKELPTGTPNMHDIARALGTTRRTLHRKLALEGTNFRLLVEELRKEEVRVRLSQANDSSLTSLALDLGFADLSTFSRAHRRWFGLAPSRMRGR